MELFGIGDTRLTERDGDIKRYLSDVHRVLHNALLDNFIGLYLHGSLAMGAFLPSRSDIDIIATLDWPLSDMQREELRHAASKVPLPSIVSGLDLTLLTTKTARHPSEDASWEAAIQVRHVHASQQAQMRDRSDPFLFIDVAIVREYGVALAGPRADESFGPVAAGLITDACGENCRVWANRDVFHDPTSGVLNVCRAWRFLEEGDLVSKVEAGEWAKSRTDKGELVESAVTVGRGDASAILSHADVKEFCQGIARLFEERGFRKAIAAPDTVRSRAEGCPL